MYLIFDEETQTHHSRKRKANPFDDKNYIVMRGWKKQGDKLCTAEHFHSKDEVTPLVIPDDVTVLAGHNIKFDLLYEMMIPGGYENLQKFYKRGGKIWCTQYAEYLLRGMDRKYHMVAMDQIIESYGGRVKIDGIKALWNAGVLTSDINPQLLQDYLIGTKDEGYNSGDIGNSELIYVGQLKEATENNMVRMIEARMDGLAATTEMEYRGLKVDVAVAKEQMKELQAEHETVKSRLQEYISFIPEEVQFNWNSGVHVSCLLFGGTIKYEKRAPYLDEATGELARLKATERQPIFRGKTVSPSHPKISWDADRELYYAGSGNNIVWQDTYISGKKVGQGKSKNVAVQGEIKVKYQDFFFELPGITEPDKSWKGALLDGKGGPIYGTGKDIIEELGTRDIPFLKDFSRNAAIEKELGTYYIAPDKQKKGQYKGMLACVAPEDHIVHHSLNHVNTVTSRLSSNNPNMQNIPRADKSKVKKMFVTRMGEDGVMIEIDYSQLEVVVQGLLSGDPHLVRDLNDRIDFHCKRVALKHNIDYDTATYYCKDESYPEFKMWKGRRTACKEFSFQRAYGAGAAAIAASTGMDVEEVKNMIALEEKEYPGVKVFNDSVASEVNQTAVPFRDGENGWRMFRKGTWQAPTGTIYTFRSYDPPAWSKSKVDTFMPTELKNYPIQGTGGEIVQLILGKLWRWFVKNDNFGNKAFLVNTVHDCYWVDSHKDVHEKVARGMLTIMQAVPQFLKATYGIDCPVPFPAEAETGPNMYDMKHFH